MEINIYSLITFIVIFLNVLLFIFIYDKQKTNKSLKFYLYFLICILGWQLFELFNRTIDFGVYSLILKKISKAFATFLGFFIFRFVMEFLKKKTSKFFLWTCILYGIILEILILFSDKIVKDVTIWQDWGRSTITGDLFYLYGIFISSFFFISLVILLLSYVKEKKTKKSRTISLIFFGLLISSFGGSIIDALVTIMRINLMPLSGIFTLLMAITIVIAIYKFNFLGTTPKQITIYQKFMSVLILFLIIFVSIGILNFNNVKEISSISNLVTINNPNFAAENEKINHSYDLFIRIMAVLIFLLVIFIYVINLLIKKYISTPIISLQESANSISKGEFKTEISMNTNDEIGDLAKSFDNMRKQILLNQTQLEKKVKEKTKELESQVSTLEKIRDLTADSEIYAEKMRIERDKALKLIKKPNKTKKK
jgi:HAMP domain-containing protein